MGKIDLTARSSWTRFNVLCSSGILAFVTWWSNSNQLPAGECRSLESAYESHPRILGGCSIMQDLQINRAFHRECFSGPPTSRAHHGRR